MDLARIYALFWVEIVYEAYSCTVCRDDEFIAAE